MSPYDCDTIRDVLPSFVRGELLPHETDRVEQHLTGCADCADEARIVRLVQVSLAPMPQGLEARVIGAVRGRRPVRQRIAAPFAIAATIASAVIGGALVFQQVRNGDTLSIDVDAVSWAAAEDPLLHGRSSLQDLSVDELEYLLEELDP